MPISQGARVKQQEYYTMTDKMIVLADLGRVKAFRVTYDMMTSKPQLELVHCIINT
jgi:hypothetical protein